MMRLFLAIPIVMLPNTTHFPPDVAVGTSVALLVLTMLLGERDPDHLMARPPLLVPPLIAL